MIGAQLRSMAATTDILVFQMGFCWKGNRNLGLFENGTKREVIDFVIEHSNDTYQLEHIGVPVMRAEKVIYEELDEENVNRDDSLGEFLNRPIFVLRTIK